MKKQNQPRCDKKGEKKKKEREKKKNEDDKDDDDLGPSLPTSWRSDAN